MPRDREKLAKLTVAALRELAKKQLGPGTSKLRTKAQLIEAIASGRMEAAPVRTSAKKAPPKVRAAGRGLPRKATRLPRRRSTTGRSSQAPIESAAAPDLQDEPAAPEAVLALPLDARTLLVRWKPVPVRGSDERWELEVFSDGGQPARTIQIAPQSRQAQVRPLVPGPVYRARLVAQGSNGQRRVIGSLSRPVVFFSEPTGEPAGEPAGKPGPVSAPERFVRYSWSEPARSALGKAQPAPGLPLPAKSELAALGMAAASQPGPSGEVVSSPMAWFRSSDRPTSFANP